MRIRPLVALMALLAAALVPTTHAPVAATGPARPAGVSAADLELLRATAARYHDLSSFELRGALRLSVLGGPKPQTLEAPFIVAYQRPGKLRDEFRNPSGDMLQISDGHERIEYFGQLKQYRRHSHPIGDDAVAEGTAGGNLAFGIGLVKMFSGLADSATSVRRLGMETLTVDGVARPCVMVEVNYPSPAPSASAANEGPRTYWLDRDDHRLLRVRSTLTRMSAQGPMRVQQETRFDRVRLGQPVADSLFTLTPPAGARLVKQWEMPGQPPTAELVGQDAEDFELADLDGHPHRLSTHKGSVVLLDFWATWCGPCRLTMPLVDKLEREYRSRGLVVYSINLRENHDAAADYIKKKGYGMTTLLDQKGTTGDAYQVNGIPALFIIGKDGKIAAHMVGVQQEDDLREAIEDAGVR